MAKLLEEDEAFIENMKSERSFTIGGLDTKRYKMMERREERARRQEEFRKKAEQESLKMNESVGHDALENVVGLNSEEIMENRDDSESDAVEPPTKEPRRSHRRTVKTGTQIFIPHDAIADSGVVGYEARTHNTVTHTIGFLSTIIDRFGGDKSKVNLSYSQAYRCRIAAVAKYADIVQEGWVCPKPAALHWDGKIMNDLENQYKQKDRLPILVSGVKTHKLLGAPALPIKSGESAGKLISDQAMILLDKWGCREQIASMVFDTTASNTGHLSAACVSIQTKLDRPLLWSACRKHIGELIIGHVWDDLKIEVSSSKDTNVFKRFREQGYENTAHTFTEERVLTTQDASKLGEFAESQASIARKLINDLRDAKAYDRGDYKECLDLMEAYMGDNLSYNFLKPGAVHKARWMGKQLYCYKIVLLQDNLRPGIASKAQIKKIKRIVNFCTYVYNIWWFQCPLATSAPALDMELVSNLKAYEAIDEAVAKSALQAFRKHTWYLHAEMVPLALWDENLEASKKAMLAQKILEQPTDDTDSEAELQFVGRHGTGYGKPDLLAVNIDSSELSDLVTPASWRFFKILSLSTEFINSPPQEWSQNVAYQKASEVFRYFKVTNEDAERSVKLCADFLGVAKKEEYLQNYMQVVEAERNSTPDIRKSTKRKQKPEQL